MAYQSVSRPAASRHNVVTREVEPEAAGCRNCGGIDGAGKLYQFGRLQYAGRVDWERGHYCSKGCRSEFERG